MVEVTKLNGEKEGYNPNKLRRSLVNSGADKETINRIMSKVGDILYDGIPTKKLFRFVFREFKKSQPLTAGKYDLKNSILRLGKEGYAFEKLVARIFQKKGYAAKLNLVVKGRFIKHEIDVSAKRDKEIIMVECKHHSKPWISCNVQTALYVYARFLDVRNFFTFPMLVTNTRFSNQSVTYSRGVGLKLMGWKYPKGDSLEYNIERFKLYPITMLCSMDEQTAEVLLRKGIILADTLGRKSVDEISKMLEVTKEKAEKYLKEARTLCREEDHK